MARVVITSADGAWARDFQVSENLDLSRLFVGLVRFARFLEANGYLQPDTHKPTAQGDEPGKGFPAAPRGARMG